MQKSPQTGRNHIYGATGFPLVPWSRWSTLRTLLSVLCILLLAVAAAPLAEAAPGSGRLSFATAPILDGTLSGSGSGEVHAADPATHLQGSGAQVRVLKVWYDVDVIRNPVGPVGTDTSEVQKEWRNFTDAVFHLESTGERFETLTYTTGEGHVQVPEMEVVEHAITAFAEPWLVQPAESAGGQPQDDERVFTYAAPGDRFPTAHSEMQAEGDFVVYLGDATFRVLAEGEEARFTSGVERTETSPASHRDRYSYHLVVVESGALALQAEDAVAWLADPTFRFTGTMTATEANGRIDMGGERYDIDDVPVTVGGSIELRPQPVGSPEPVKSNAFHLGTGGRTVGIYAATASDLDGEVTVLAIGSEIPYTNQQDLAVVATVGVMTLAGAVALMTPKGKWLVLTMLTPLYAKTERDRLLDNESRDRIFQAIRNNPGINLSQVHRIADLGWGVTVYHLKMMEKNGLVFSEPGARDKCFFENDPKFRSLRAAISAIANKEPALRVAQVVAVRPGLTQRDVVAETGLTQRAVSYYVGKLTAKGLVEAEREGNYVHYRPSQQLVDALRLVAPEGTDLSYATPAAAATVQA